jgi:hypothetical protein
VHVVRRELQQRTRRLLDECRPVVIQIFVIWSFVMQNSILGQAALVFPRTRV